MSHARIPAFHQRGFTLIELMIVVVVITILTAIALPSYQSYVMKSRRTDAKNGLLDLASREERYFSVNNTYTNVPANLGYGATSTFPLAINASGQSYYSLNVTSVIAASGSGATAVPPGFTAQAVPIGTQAADTTCATYQIDQLGTQTNSSGATPGCW